MNIENKTINNVSNCSNRIINIYFVNNKKYIANFFNGIMFNCNLDNFSSDLNKNEQFICYSLFKFNEIHII